MKFQLHKTAINNEKLKIEFFSCCRNPKGESANKYLDYSRVILQPSKVTICYQSITLLWQFNSTTVE